MNKILIFILLFISQKIPASEELCALPIMQESLDENLGKVVEKINSFDSSCFKEKVHQPNFSSLYFGQQNIGLRDAISQYMNEEEKKTEVLTMLWERPPEEHVDFNDLIINRSLVADRTSSGHGRGTMGVMASHSEASTGTAQAVKILVTNDSSPQAAIESIKNNQNKWPAVINASHSELSLIGKTETEATKIKNFIRESCKNGTLISIAAGNGGPIGYPQDEDLKDCFVVVGSLNGALKHSERSSVGDQVSISAPSDRYQYSSGMYHGFTSGATPMISAAMIAAKKIMPEISPKAFKQLLEKTSDQLEHLSYPNSEEGHGKINGAKLIMAIKLYKDGKIDPLKEDRISIEKKISRNLSSDKFAYSSLDKIHNDLNHADTCEKKHEVFQKLKLSFMIYKDHPIKEQLKSNLRSFYKGLDDLHNLVLLDSRDPKSGKINISKENFDGLLKVDFKNIDTEQKFKLLDLIGEMNLTNNQLAELREKYYGLLISSIPEDPKDNDKLRVITKMSLTVLGDHFVNEEAKDMPIIQEMIDSIRSKMNGSSKLDSSSSGLELQKLSLPRSAE
jgi:hypothetical protein